MVNHTPYARSRVRVQPAPKPFKQEALVRLLNSTKFRPITHVEVKLYVDISNGTPEDQWLKTATRQYEKAETRLSTLSFVSMSCHYNETIYTPFIYQWLLHCISKRSTKIIMFYLQITY